MTMTAELNLATKHDSVGKWYASATVRNAERILVPTNPQQEYIYPRARQVLADHPIVAGLGFEAVAYVLAQSAYKYMYEIGLLETRFVIDCALNIVNNLIGSATDDEKREALTIVIDEGYHAYVALDFIVQMKATTKVEPVEIPETNGNLSAVKRAFARLPKNVHMDFQLISVCLAEHTLTRDLLSIGKEKETAPTFTQVMSDHVSDEGRHATYFAKLMKAHWAMLPDETKRVIGPMLPHYLDDYLANDWTRAFDRKVLEKVGLTADQVRTVMSDTDPLYRENGTAYITKTRANLVKLLQRSGFLDHEATRTAFAAHQATIQ